MKLNKFCRLAVINDSTDTSLQIKSKVFFYWKCTPDLHIIIDRNRKSVKVLQYAIDCMVSSDFLIYFCGLTGKYRQIVFKTVCKRLVFTTHVLALLKFN